MAEPVAPFKVGFCPSEVEHYVARARAVLESGRLIPGVNNADLEERFAEFIGASHAVAVASGTCALEIIVRACDLGGAGVLVPANTNYATAEAVLRAGCRPVLYDSGLYPDLDAIEAGYAEDVAALIVVHIGGYLSPQLPAIAAWCDRRGVRLIEDASHAHGARLNEQHAGTFGAAAAFSLFATKVLTSAEGGLITTANPALAALCRRYRDQGKAEDGIHHTLFGSAWRMSELHAALGAVQMDGLSAGVERNDRFVRQYAEGITHPKVRAPYEPSVRYSGHKFILTTEGPSARESLRAHLYGKGIAAAKGVYEVPLHRQPVLGLGAGRRFPVADRFAGSHLCLPMWKGLSEDDVLRVIDAVNSWTGVG